MEEQPAEQEVIRIFDTTLRDGNQTHRNKFTVEEKVRFALQLEKMGVDAIETGFPFSNETDYQAMERISDVVERPILYGLARIELADIDAVFKVVKKAKNPGIHTFVATSEKHMREKLKMTPQQVLKAAIAGVKHAAEMAPHVVFSPEDATRSDWDFLAETCTAAIEQGATVINVPDTVGIATPEYYLALVEYLIAHVSGSNNIVWSAHVHNDRGLATAATLAGIHGGIREVQCTVNGIGERGGNTSLEQIIVNLKDSEFDVPAAVRRTGYGGKFRTNIVSSLIYPTSRMLVNMTGNEPGHHQPSVGLNAYQHEAGIHAQAPGLYEAIPAEMIGRRGGRIVIGAHSGRHAIEQAAAAAGYELNPGQIRAVAGRMKSLEEVKREVTGSEVGALIEEIVYRVPETYKLEAVRYQGGGEEDRYAESTVIMTVNGERKNAYATGDGPVNASIKAIQEITGKGWAFQVIDYGVDGKGSEDQMKVRASIQPNGHEVRGIGVDTDSVLAQIKAYLNCLNRAVYMEQNNRTGTIPHSSEG